MGWLFGAVAQVVLDLLGRPVFRWFQRPERRRDVLSRDREIFSKIDGFLNEPELDQMCNVQLYNGRLSRELGHGADELRRFLEREGSRFATRRLVKRAQEVEKKLADVLDFTGTHFFPMELWEGWALYPEFNLMGREAEYYRYLSDIRHESGELWETYLRFRKAVRKSLVV
jgi:hypothetical protein